MENEIKFSEYSPQLIGLFDTGLAGESRKTAIKLIEDFILRHLTSALPDACSLTLIWVLKTLLKPFKYFILVCKGLGVIGLHRLCQVSHRRSGSLCEYVIDDGKVI